MHLILALAHLVREVDRARSRRRCGCAGAPQAGPPRRRGRCRPGSARARPATVAFLVRRAISATASKSPFEAIGKPASMMSTPMASSSSATSSFSSKRHRGAGALLAVAERGVENQDAVLGGPVGGCIGHGLRPRAPPASGTLEILQCGPARSWVATPESPGVLKPSRPSGAAKKQETGQKRARGRRPNGRVEHHAMGAG